MTSVNRGMPTSPFEIEATKDILARRIENGDIQQSDLDLLKKGYKWMTTASFLGSIGMAIPTILFLRRKQPPVGLGVKLLAAGGMGMLGSFLGFTVGGAAAAAEVNRSMENPQQKLKVFQEIATEARRASIERSMGGVPSTANRPFPSSRPSPSSGSGSMGVESSTSTWASESALDRSELESERNRASTFGGDMRDIQRDSGFGDRSSNPSPRSEGMSLPTPTGSERAGLEEGRKRGGEANQDTWGKLRQTAFPSADKEGQGGVGVDRGQMRENERMGSGSSLGGTGDSRVVAERTKEQREFDELLERERRGVDRGDKWA